MAVVMKKSKALKSVPAAAPIPIELPEGMWDRIAKKAYELWEARGRRDGQALQNWLDAEQIVMDEIHEARE
ncbi:DUF2934 domain-containing protein [Nitrospira moscoviensis]|uniref:DUF2934 domain-containing protein n=1 Tax=Nitrospira moscoviensis TaxID=42253 RepID=A0A0K2GGZ9_NITMO|nr:DUF2934 domain-containing protein [Nitrospira moscoviensis]ALA60216.1 hypothetical protein NITMOv2_3827 [Nitrospira moscoviensis]